MQKKPRTPEVPLSPSQAASPVRATQGDAQTRELLVHAGLRLFARHGLEAVSLRQVIAEANQSNQSAVQYYFGGKPGLVSAVLDHVIEQMQPLHAQAESTLRSISVDRTPTVKEIVTMYLTPFATWYATSEEGRRSFRFLSRLTWQADLTEYTMLISKGLPYYEPLIERLQAALPSQAREAIALKVVIALGTVIHSMADMRVLRGIPVPSSGAVAPANPWMMFEQFVNFLAGGLSAS